MAPMPVLPHRSPADHFALTARTAARRVMRSYSTSFSLATSALPGRIRAHIEAVYAMVRVADELVDGAWEGADPADLHVELDRFETVIARAVQTGFSTDLVAHAFALTSRRTGIGPAQWEPFFASMRSDIPADPVTATVLSRDQLVAYIHGSAEVVGEMCVLAFFDGAPLPADAEHRLLPGARALGSAFQKVNFLRDIAHDSARLRRGYVVAPGQAQTGFTTGDRDRLTGQIFAELARAAPAIDLLPTRVRPAVWTAFGVFAELTHRIAATPAHRIARTRIRVPDPVKAGLAARAAAGRPRTSWPGLDRAAADLGATDGAHTRSATTSTEGDSA